VYKGDFAKAVDVIPEKNGCVLRIIPRLDFEEKTQSIAQRMKNKDFNVVRPSAKLFLNNQFSDRAERDGEGFLHY
jgi:hypothetical protein